MLKVEKTLTITLSEEEAIAFERLMQWNVTFPNALPRDLKAAYLLVNDAWKKETPS